MAATSLNEHVHNSTELNSCEGTMSRKILGYRILLGFHRGVLSGNFGMRWPAILYARVVKWQYIGPQLCGQRNAAKSQQLAL
jgi:hypothetical protein